MKVCIRCKQFSMDNFNITEGILIAKYPRGSWIIKTYRTDHITAEHLMYSHCSSFLLTMVFLLVFMRSVLLVSVKTR